ncbi:MAG TPA: TolC family protein [Acidobacteriaceae bacterium]|nr:TolC family protein [Acidobacteriaceae bacterium]
MSRPILMLTLACSLSAVAQQVNGAPAGPTTPGGPITLEQAISLARANEPGFAAAAANARITGLDHSIAQAALLPTVTYHNQVLYTQPNGAFNGGGPVGSQSAPRFIANNAVREYASQAVITDTLGLQQVNAVSRAAAAQAVSSAELEVARRGLVNTVTGLFYQALADDHKADVARRAAGEAANFTQLTQQRETAREAAHADVVKAQLQQQQRDRDLADALLEQQKSHLDLGVLLFSDPRTTYTLAPGAVVPLPSKADVDAVAMKSNPELRSALATLELSNLGVTAARDAYLPDLALNFTYGIDAVQFAVNGRDGVKNLGYSASATLDIPVWDWLSTQHRVKQSEITRDAARTALTATQRRLVAQLDETYAEAGTSHDQLQSLDQSVQTARESLRLTRLRYTAGEATVLEVVDAENSLTTAEIAREDGAVRYQMAMTNLQLLTGAI